MLPYTFHSVKPRGTRREIQKWSAKGRSLLRFRGFTVFSHTQAHKTHLHIHIAQRPLSWQTLWSVLRTHCSCCHCWNTAVTEWFSVTTGDWRLATGKYVTASLGFTSQPSTRFSLACMIQLKMHTWQWPSL